MNSVSHNLGFVQDYRVTMRDFGISAKRSRVRIRGAHLDGVKRGKIRGFSANSVQRLKKTIIEKWVPDSQVVGITLTLPWRKEFPGLDSAFRDSVHRFSIAFKRAYPNSACIYRVELQERGMPHLHMICFFGKGDRFLSDEIVVMWWKHGFMDIRDGKMAGYVRKGVKCEPLNENASRLVMYICDHTSKRKQAQLGWKGRQWGIINRRNLRWRPSKSLPPFSSGRSEGYFWRLVHRLTRYRVKADCPFGFRYTRPRRKEGITFGLSPATVMRCWQLAEEH